MLFPLFPNLKKRRVRKMINELRSKGVSKVPTEKAVVNRPAVKAYELGREIIIDSNVIDLESARSIHCIHYYSPEALMQKVSEGWDKKWIEEVLENRKAFMRTKVIRLT